MRYRTNTRFIILEDECNHPVAWAGEQLCFVDSHEKAQKESSVKDCHLLTSYTLEEAKKYIELSKAYRASQNFKVFDYKIIPILL